MVYIVITPYVKNFNTTWVLRPPYIVLSKPMSTTAWSPCLCRDSTRPAPLCAVLAFTETSAWQSCSKDAAYLRHTCGILAAYLRHTCGILVAYLCHTCGILAAYLRHSCVATMHCNYAATIQQQFYVRSAQLCTATMPQPYIDIALQPCKIARLLQPSCNFAATKCAVWAVVPGSVDNLRFRRLSFIRGGRRISHLRFHVSLSFMAFGAWKQGTRNTMLH